MQKIKRLAEIVFIALVSVVALSGCDEPEIELMEQVSRPVKLFTVGTYKVSQTYKFPGSVSAVRQSDMAFEVPGRVVSMPVTEGARVQQGDILAELDPRDYESERDRARAEYNAALTDFNRYDRAYKAQAVTKQQLDQAKRALEVAEAGFQKASKAVDDTVLRAPFTGRIARKLVDDFANVQSKQPILVLQSDDELEMRVNVPEAKWVQDAPVHSPLDIVTLGELYVVLSSLPRHRIPAKITAFSGSADPVTRTFEVTVGFESPGGVSISPGMTGHVAYTPPIDSGDSNKYTVPVGAVVASANGSSFVWIYNEESGNVSKRIVEVGTLSGESIYVVSGLEIGDRIAESGVHTLYDGYPVHPLED